MLNLFAEIATGFACCYYDLEAWVFIMLDEYDEDENFDFFDMLGFDNVTYDSYNVTPTPWAKFLLYQYATGTDGTIQEFLTVDDIIVDYVDDYGNLIERVTLS